MRLLGAALLVSALALFRPTEGRSSASAPPPVFSDAAYRRLLARYVDPSGHVDYAGLRRDPRGLETALATFAAVSPESRPQVFPTRTDRLAYWINAYNLFVLAGVSRRWPIRTVRSPDDDSFFRTERFTAGGRRYTLDAIETGIIRGRFREPRIHFTVNCGAVSCPALAPAPFTGADLDRRLDQAARLFVNDPQLGVRFDAAQGTVTLSEIFRWYEDDFLAALRDRGIERPTVLDYVALYLEPPARARLTSRTWTVRYAPYDWTLNATTLPVR